MIVLTLTPANWSHRVRLTQASRIERTIKLRDANLGMVEMLTRKQYELLRSSRTPQGIRFRFLDEMKDALDLPPKSASTA